MSGRELVISNLKEAGAGLAREAALHPHSDTADIEARECAALEHWEALLEQHTDKVGAVAELGQLVVTLQEDVAAMEQACRGVQVSPEDVEDVEKELEKMGRDLAAMFDYTVQLQERVGDAAADSCSDDFNLIAVSTSPCYCKD